MEEKCKSYVSFKNLREVQEEIGYKANVADLRVVKDDLAELKENFGQAAMQKDVETQLIKLQNNFSKKMGSFVTLETIRTTL